MILSNSIAWLVQTTRCTMIRFCWSIPLSIDYVWNSSIDRLSRLVHAHMAYEIYTAKIIAAFCRIFYCLHDLIRWIQSSAMCKQQDVRCCCFRWSIPISIDYVWSVYIDSAIYTPWYSYCIWNSYIKNHHWQLAWCGKRSLMQGCSEAIVRRW